MSLVDVIIVIALVLLSGLFSGLTLGLMSLNKFALKRKVQLRNKEAMMIYPLRKKGNLLLCTLILGNVAVNASIALFLGSLTAGITAGFIATGLIVLFGEILPQGVFNKYALTLGAKTAWLTYIAILIFYPIAKPLSMALDAMLGRELPRIYPKEELVMLLKQHMKSKRSRIDEQDFELLRKGLLFSEKKVKDIMTPKSKASFLQQDTLLTKRILNSIRSKGHSRMPVLKNKRVAGVLYAKDLIAIDPDDKVPIKRVMRKKIEFIREGAQLDEVLELFKKRKVHLFVVRDKFLKLTGIVTLEDVLEEIVGEIVDEYDLTRDLKKGNL